MIPSATLTETIEVFAATGTTGLGTKALTTSVKVRCAVAEYHGVVPMPDGSVARASFRAFVRPGVTFPLGSVVVWRGDEYTVRELALATSPRGDEAVALTLVGAA